MKNAPIRGWLLAVAMLSVLAIAATPAHATATPVNATVSALLTDSFLSTGGQTIRGPRGDFTGSINGAGTALSGRLTFGRTAAATCTEDSLFRLSAVVDCRGLVTLRSTSSVAGNNMSGTYAVDAGFQCSVNVGSGTCVLTIRGPQTPTGVWTFSQATQPLTVDARTISVTADNPSFLCRSTTTASFGGRYRVTSVNGRAGDRITISKPPTASRRGAGHASPPLARARNTLSG